MGNPLISTIVPSCVVPVNPAFPGAVIPGTQDFLRTALPAGEGARVGGLETNRTVPRFPGGGTTRCTQGAFDASLQQAQLRLVPGQAGHAGDCDPNLALPWAASGPPPWCLVDWNLNLHAFTIS